MTKQEKIKLIQDLVNHYKDLESNCNQIANIFGCDYNSKFFTSIWGAFDAYMELVQKSTEDVFDWIPWFIYDNECGKRNIECEVRGGVKVKVKTVKQLVELIDDFI
jgi:hypothetical protein